MNRPKASMSSRHSYKAAVAADPVTWNGGCGPDNKRVADAAREIRRGGDVSVSTKNTFEEVVQCAVENDARATDDVFSLFLSFKHPKSNTEKLAASIAGDPIHVDITLRRWGSGGEQGGTKDRARRGNNVRRQKKDTSRTRTSNKTHSQPFSCDLIGY